MEVRVKGAGPTRPRLIGIGEAPGEEEVHLGIPFVGPSGKVQDGILSSAGLQREEVYLDNIVPIRPPLNKIERLYELGFQIDDFLPALSDTLKRIECPVVVAYGETALNSLTGYEGITKHRGSIYPCLLDSSKLVIPTFHPRFVIENWKMRGVVVQDVLKALRIAKEGYHGITFNTIIKPTLHEVIDFIQMLQSANKLSYDIETVGSGAIACLGLGTEALSTGRISISIPFKFGYNNYWSYTDELYIWQLLQDLWRSEGLKIAQNANYDLTKLLPFLGEPSPPWYDLMVAYHLIEPELPHTLAFMTSIFTDVNYYKDDPKDEELSWKYTTSSEKLWEYNCLMKGNRVLTDRGSIPIEKIIRYKMPIKALSFNEKTKEIEYKSIIGWHHQKARGQNWIRIATKMKKRGLVVTPEHQIRLTRGWTEAKDVKLNDHIFINEEELTLDEIGFIIGTLFGDSSFGSKKSEELSYIQCIQASEPLINLKKKVLNRISLDTTPFMATNGFKPGMRYSFISRSLYQFESIRTALIIGGIKRPYLLEYLTPKGLAIWYMDDGCIIQSRNGRQAKASLALHGFDPADRAAIQGWFIQRYDESANITSVGALVMSVGMSKKFCEEVSPFIIPELRYKLPYQLHPYKEFSLEQSNHPAATRVLAVEDYYFEGKAGGYNNTRYCITVEDNHNFFTPFGLVANCKDVEVNLMLEPKLTEELKEMGLLNRFYGFDMPKMRVYWRMQQRGISIDEEVRGKVLIEQTMKMGEKKQELREAVGYDLNPLSPKQMIQFLYTDLKIPPHYQRKTKKLTADKETLEKLIARYPHPEFQLALDVRDLIKDIGTYLVARTDEDGKMRSRYNICGTTTGRTSSRKTYDATGLDMQNVPEDLRPMFKAEEGKVLLVYDLWQAETWIVAILSQCQAFLEKLRRGEKVHKLVASWIFDKPEGDIDNVNHPGGEYFLGKRTNHAAAYGLGPNLFSVLIKRPVREAKEIMSKYHSHAPEIEQWHKEVQEELTRTRMLMTPFGRKRIFRERLGDDLFRKAYAHVPQSTIAEYNQQAIVKLEYWLPVGAEIVQEGFDSLMIEAPEENTEEIKKLVERAFDKELFWKGIKFKIPVECAGVGTHWRK